MYIRNKIEEIFFDVLDQTDSNLLADKLDDNVVLLESGLDSLGFATLVAILEDELDYDPFSISDEAIYPSTYGEFVEFYEKMNPYK